MNTRQKKTIEQIQSHLKKQGCVCVAWTADVFSVYDVVKDDSGKRKGVENVQATQNFRKNLKELKRSTETQWQKSEPFADYADIIHSTWSEEWITENDGLISIILTYYFPKKGYEDYRLWVYITLFTPSSSKYPYVKRYKERHPEQFPQSSESEKEKQVQTPH